MSLGDDETTVRIHRDSISQTVPTLFPSVLPTETELSQLQRAWENLYAAVQMDNEELRAQVRALLEENGKIRDVLNKVRGPR